MPDCLLNRIDLRGRDLSTARLRALLPRAAVDVDAVAALVRPVLDAVRERGVAAAREYSHRFDGVAPDPVRVPQRRLAEALDALDPVVRAALTEAAARARLVHRDQRRAEVR